MRLLYFPAIYGGPSDRLPIATSNNVVLEDVFHKKSRF